MFKKVTHTARRSSKGRRNTNLEKQRGAIAIEFAALFAVFFIILYAVMAYSLPLLLTLTFKQLSSDAGRAAIKVDQALPDTEYIAVVAREVTRVVDSSWLPKGWVTGNCPTPKETGIAWMPLPSSPSSGSYGFIAKDSLDKKPDSSIVKENPDTEEDESNNYRYILQVCLQRKYNTAGKAEERAIIPTINLLGIKIPSLPEVDGEVVIRTQTTVRL